LSEDFGRVPKEELAKWEDKHMVETPEQGKMGINHKAFKENGYICIKDQSYQICTSVNPTQMRSCIFWTKISAMDKVPTWAKVVNASFVVFISPITAIEVQFHCVQH
jgi:hypothetical protein